MVLMIIDVIKILDKPDLYSINKLFYSWMNITQTSNFYLSKDAVKEALVRIEDFCEKYDIPVEIRWHYPNKDNYSKKRHKKKGVDSFGQKEYF